MSAGAKDPNCAYMECIGRYQKDIGCNFAAYGFLGIPYGGYVIEGGFFSLTRSLKPF